MDSSLVERLRRLHDLHSMAGETGTSIMLAEAASRIETLEAEVKRLRSKIDMQAHDAKKKDDALHAKNVALDGMAWVWWNGGCTAGTGRYTDLEVTEEMVAMIERNAKRLRTWFTNKKFRAALTPPVS